jgi:hypothetical protein
MQVNRIADLGVLVPSAKEGTMTSTRQSRIIRLVVTALVLTGTATVAAAPTSEAIASTSAACTGITWGSLPKADGFVSYVPQVYTEGKGDPLTLRGGAKLKVAVMGEVQGVRTGRHECYDRLVIDRAPGAQLTAQPGQEIANAAGYSTFREVAYGGTLEGYTTIGLGVRARLPMRVFILPGPGNGDRFVVDVAHHW